MHETSGRDDEKGDVENACGETSGLGDHHALVVHCTLLLENVAQWPGVVFDLIVTWSSAGSTTHHRETRGGTPRSRTRVARPGSMLV